MLGKNKGPTASEKTDIENNFEYGVEFGEVEQRGAEKTIIKCFNKFHM